jgi:hypothetical protein
MENLWGFQPHSLAHSSPPVHVGSVPVGGGVLNVSKARALETAGS